MEIPSMFRKLASDEIGKVKANPASAGLLPRQEPRTKPSRAIPYELYANCQLSDDGKHIEIEMQAGNRVFGPKSSGAPFKIYATGNYRKAAGNTSGEHDVNNGSSSFERRSEEHTSELQSLMRISYAVFCLKKKKKKT